MERKKAALSETITIPVTEAFKKLMVKFADTDQRTIGQFCRIWLERAAAEEAPKAGLAKEAEAAGLEITTPV